MRRTGYSAAFLAIAMLLVLRISALADAFAVTVPSLTKPPSLSGAIDESWAAAAQVPVSYDFTYQRSGEPTTAYIAQDRSGLYVAFDVRQQEAPTAATQTNGAGVLNDDNVTVALWPEGFQGFTYTFTANINGARYQTSSENSAFTPQWIAAAHRTPSGYTVTMHIPFGVIRSGGSKVWHVQLSRTTVAANSTQIWAHAAGQRNANEAQYSGTMKGINAGAGATPSRPKPRVQVYALGQAAPASLGGDTSHMGADVSIPVTATSSFVGTFHPDYSNVEIDQQTISPTAFARRFSEVRPFFTQVGQNFNNTFSCTNCPTTLYTPAIPTFRDGYAYEGTQGRFSFAAFDAAGDDRTDSAETLNYTLNDPKQILGVALQRVAVDMPGFDDVTTTIDTGYENRKSHLFTYLNAGMDRGTNVTIPGRANYYEYGGGFVDKTTTVGLTLQKIDQQFNPAIGFVPQTDIAGYFAFANKTFNFSKTARLQDISFNSYFGRYHDHNGNTAQTNAGGQVNFDLRSQFSLHLYLNSQGVQTFTGELLPFNANGWYVSYRGNTSTPSSVGYVAGAYSHGTLRSWSYLTTLPLPHHLHLSLEDDENVYASPLAAEPTAKQWLERASLDWQVTRDASFDIGARRIIGRNLPNAFQVPDYPTTALPFGTINGFAPFDYVNAGNVSLAFHVLALRNEFYAVYGNP
ncbi:MAG: hypothetical protein JO165_05825, partial [Candidatus Eremiobacteraeota bacterium]|nr:hypothetical protein [Candidatus Eremiobacteraeota bacterium]